MGQTINPLGKDIIKVETELCGRTLSLEVGRVGFRTSASVLGALSAVVCIRAVKKPITNPSGPITKTRDRYMPAKMKPAMTGMRNSG